MKPLYALTTLFLVCISCTSIKKTTAKDAELIMFTKAVSYFEVIKETYIDHGLQQIDTTTAEGKIKHSVLTDEKEDILELSLDTFEAFIKTYPSSKLYPKALYNLAHINALLNDSEEEIYYLELLLASKANDKDNSGRHGLMANPYANYKHEASNRLTEIFIKQKDFEKALQYKKINEKYPLQHFCGNAFAAEKMYNAQHYASIYKGMGDVQKALKHLLPHIFDGGLASNNGLVVQTVNLLQVQYDTDTLKTRFDAAVNNYYAKTVQRNDDEWTNYYITFFDTEIEIPSWRIFEEDQEKVKAQIIDIIKKSEFYRLLHGENVPEYKL